MFKKSSQLLAFLIAILSLTLIYSETNVIKYCTSDNKEQPNACTFNSEVCGVFYKGFFNDFNNSCDACSNENVKFVVNSSCSNLDSVLPKYSQFCTNIGQINCDLVTIIPGQDPLGCGYYFDGSHQNIYDICSACNKNISYYTFDLCYHPVVPIPANGHLCVNRGIMPCSQPTAQDEIVCAHFGGQTKTTNSICLACSTKNIDFYVDGPCTNTSNTTTESDLENLYDKFLS